MKKTLIAGTVMALLSHGAMAANDWRFAAGADLWNAQGSGQVSSVGADGSYRVTQLPIGDYQLQVKRAGADLGDAVGINVPLGGTTTVNLGSEGGVVNLNAVQVVGSRVINRVDVRSTESATTINREELARLPVALLPGPVIVPLGACGASTSTQPLDTISRLLLCGL